MRYPAKNFHLKKLLSKMDRFCRPQKRKKGGQALVELALCLPLLILIFSALFDFGRVVSVSCQMEVFAEDFARFALKKTPLSQFEDRLKLNLPAGVTLTRSKIQEEISPEEGISTLTIPYQMRLLTIPMRGIFGDYLNYQVKFSIFSRDPKPLLPTSTSFDPSQKQEAPPK